MIGSRQLGVSNPTSRIRKVDVCDVCKALPSDQIISLIPDVEVFGRRDKYINGPYILKEVGIVDAFLHENFPHIRTKHK